MDLTGQTILKRYRLDVLMDRGNLFSTYRAWDERSAAFTILTLLDDSIMDDRTLLQRLEREAGAIAAFRHPQAVRSSGLEIHRKCALLFSDDIQGVSLQSELEAAQGRLSIPRVLEVLETVCKTLQVAHQAGLIHGNLSPRAIFTRPSGTIMLAGFSLPALVERPIPINTSPYTAPETRKGLPLTPQADIYALGVLLHTLLTDGKAPIPTSYKTIVMKCLDASPARRFTTPLELFDQFSAVARITLT